MKKCLLLFLLCTQALSAATPRKDVAIEDRWNLEQLYASQEAWKAELDLVVGSKNPPFFTTIAIHKGKLKESSTCLLNTLERYHEVERKLMKLRIWAHLRHDEEISEPTAKTANETIDAICHQFSQETAWITPEILALNDQKFEEYRNDPKLEQYRFLLQRIYRQKPHTLAEKEEEMLALASSALGTGRETYSALTNADFRFGNIADSDAKEHALTHGNYKNFITSKDRTRRKNAFFQLHKKYLEHENTLTELISGTVKAHNVLAKAHRYNSCLEASLAPNDIDPKVYSSLIEAVHSRIHVLHRYMKLRKKVLGLEELHIYDFYIPLVSSIDKKYSFDEAKKLVFESVKPMGNAYFDELQDGLENKRWVDRYENENKRSGAYSASCYDSMPYILMNYSGSLLDVFTLAHESGHSMHSRLSRQSQPYHYSDYSIFVAEVASTFNEELLRHYLIQKAQNNRERAFLINQKIEDIRSALFHQVLSAEFELFMHTAVENRQALTAKLLKDKYFELMQFYYGPDVTYDPELAISWARIPHFHTNFYVYQYATGISAALALSDAVLKGGPLVRDKYLNFLRAGSSDYPLNILANAGVDLSTPDPVYRALDQFDALVSELEMLLVKENNS